MKVCKEARKGARILFDAVRPQGRIDESKVRLALAAVVERKPPFEGQILHEFQRLVRLEIEKRTARVESATALDAAQKANVETSLRERFGSDIRTGFFVNPALIAGIRVQIGSDVYDANVLERLNRLRSELNH
jgi:F-type H+-transporting ATPase subunit delta